MIGLSTGWRSRSEPDGARLIAKIADMGICEVELDYRLSETALKDAVAACKKFDIKIGSVHAVSPAPPDKSKPQNAERKFLCDTDEQARRQAVEDVAETIRLAARIGAGVVVVHAGAVPMEKATARLRDLYDRGLIGSDEAKRTFNDIRIERLARRAGTFDALLKSLEELAVTADLHKVDIGLENRYYLREYVNFEELAIIFLRMQGSRIGYWHDTGHAQVQENLGVMPHREWLEEFDHKLLGLHLHDVSGYTDHLAPPVASGTGVDFAMVKKFIKPTTRKIFEFADKVSEQQVMTAIEWAGQNGLAKS